MCMQYEKAYGACFDHLFFDDEDAPSLQTTLRRDYGAAIIDEPEFIQRLMAALAKMHEDGVIAPAPVTP